MEQKLKDHIEEIHTTPLGLIRISRNLNIEEKDVISLCKEAILAKDAIITLIGKNYYVSYFGNRFTINRYNYSIITAHKE